MTIDLPRCGEATVSHVAADNARATPDPLLGAMRDAADEIDAIVIGAMTRREQQSVPLTVISV